MSGRSSTSGTNASARHLNSVENLTQPVKREQASILVVDDTPANLEVLVQMLRARGYQPRPVPNGQLALRAVEYELPDLILMDINMPGLDGISTCRKLKENNQCRDIPVIFISALTDTFDKVSAFEAGGVDYVTKPFDTEEVIARVESHIKIRNLQQQVQDRNIQLEASYRKLQELEEMRDGLVHMVIHDMRSPLSVIRSALGLLQHDLSDKMEEENREDIDDALSSANTLVNMINNLLDISRLEEGEMALHVEICDLNEIVTNAISDLGSLIKAHRVTVECKSDGIAYCDRDVVHRMMTNLLVNAVKYTPKEGEIRVVIEAGEKQLMVSVLDDGPGIAREFQSIIFEKFKQSNNAGDKNFHSSGLGLAFCKLAAESQGGKMGVDSKVGEGSRFYFTLPDSLKQ